MSRYGFFLYFLSFFFMLEFDVALVVCLSVSFVLSRSRQAASWLLLLLL